jgi:hypothetical protein
MPHNSIRSDVCGSFALKYIQADPKSDLDLGINYGLLNKLEFALNMYTYKDYALDIAYQIRPETQRWPAIAVGVRDLTYESHISSVGGGYYKNLPNVWAYDRNYYSQQGGDPYENMSFYGVLSKVIFSNFRVHWGIGRGRFVGYGPNSSYMNTDIFWGEFGPKHPYTAVGWFGALEYFQSDWFSAILEQDGRDLNFGIKYRYEFVTLNVAITKIESWFWGGVYSHRIEIGLGLQYPNPEASVAATGSIGIIGGRVFDEATQASLGAVLRVLGTRLPEVRSNPATGTFEIPKAPAGTIRLLVTRPGYGNREFQFILHPGMRYSANLPLKKIAPGGI